MRTVYRLDLTVHHETAVLPPVDCLVQYPEAKEWGHEREGAELIVSSEVD